MQTELIISTYNSPETLRLTLYTALAQRQKPDMIAIADDGSGPETRDMLAAFCTAHPQVALRHVWHEDQGFRKTVILNKAILESQADYLVFTDGDCLLSPGFMARHLALAHPQRYCCGSMLRLSARTTAELQEAEVRLGDVFSPEWLARTSTTKSMSRRLKAGAAHPVVADMLERLSPVRRTFCGANASVFRQALLKVNGYDETMVWGGEDKELGIRLQNAGLRGRHLRYTAPILHMDHAKPYVDPDRVRAQRNMIKTARRSGKHWTDHGINHAG